MTEKFPIAADQLRAMSEMHKYSKTAWQIASRYSSVLASETRDLAAAIDEALRADPPAQEPAAWQLRLREGDDWSGWQLISKGYYEQIVADKENGYRADHEVRRLAALPSSPAPMQAPHNSGERLPASDAAEGAGEAVSSEIDRLTSVWEDVRLRINVRTNYPDLARAISMLVGDSHS